MPAITPEDGEEMARVALVMRLRDWESSDALAYAAFLRWLFADAVPPEVQSPEE